MKEEFLHYVWQYKLFETGNLKTTDNQEIKIIKSGQLNSNAGPDFFNAQIKIGETIWAGNIEIHLKSSDWNHHQHQNDAAYDNVILHVVYEHDLEINNTKNQIIPTLELKKRIIPSLINNYQSLLKSKSWIACQSQLNLVDSFTINSWMERLVYERLERKVGEIEQILNQNKNDWESTYYQLLLKYIGLKVNALPFEMLAKNTPLIMLEKHRSLLSIEALLFGQAGFLAQNITDEYFQKLQKEYQFLKAKFNLIPINIELWKFLRLRPNNFPTVRIAELASLLSQHPRMFSQIISFNEIKEVKKLFNVQANEYWNNHYLFGKPTHQTIKKQFGDLIINNIIINVIVPLVFVYGKIKNDENIVEQSRNWLEQVKPEQNSIIKNWKSLQLKIENAMHSQALIELKNNYCSEKKCLNCSIGNKILKTNAI
ncbi:MAG: DUF2851 family protein [Flavobacteriales bacterium]|nr:DUF2851 family protein [Flavobacteriales bacterium]